VRVAEVNVQVGVDAQLGVPGQLGSLVPGQRLAQRGGQGQDRRDDRVAHRHRAVVAGQVQQHGEPGGGFDKGPDR
jgi:hypothetical protein